MKKGVRRVWIMITTFFPLDVHWGSFGADDEWGCFSKREMWFFAFPSPPFIGVLNKDFLDHLSGLIYSPVFCVNYPFSLTIESFVPLRT
jgi:hypothetical protein